jgi:hypothetical protein
MPTTRNARGVDLLIYSQDAQRTHSLQVKALSRPSPVPLKSHLDHLFADFVVICRNAASAAPECFVMTPAEVRAGAHRGVKDGRVSYWLQPKRSARDDFREQWDRIGRGDVPTVTAAAP